MHYTNQKAEPRYDSTLSGTCAAHDNGATIFTYNDTPITFSKGDNLMVNATQMAKAFGKEVRQWFDNEATHEFVEELASARGFKPIGGKRTSLNTSDLASRFPQLISVIKGGTPGIREQGTWMHEDVALEFARWLSPKFAIWCNDRIKELLTTGQTALKSMSPAEMLLQQAQMMVEQERRVAAMEQKVTVLEAQRLSSPDVFSVMAYSSLNGLRCNISTCKEIGKRASAICRKSGIALDTMPDPRFGRVNIYPASVLEEAFSDVLYPSKPVF